MGMRNSREWKRSSLRIVENGGSQDGLDFLLPTSEGTGACTSALVDFLVLQHNNFIERCRAVMKEREMR